MMDNLSKADEQRVVQALETAIKYANEGATPNDAIIKAADEAQFNPQLTQRMIEAFNVSKTLSHLKSAASQDRAASFPIARAEEIFSVLWPSEPETPAKAASQMLHDDYLIDQPLNIEHLLKSAEATDLPAMTDKRAEPYPQDRNLLVKKAIDDQARLSRLRGEIEQACRTAFMGVWGCVDKAAAYYQQVGYSEPFETLEKRAYATYGPAVKNFLDMVYEGGRLGDRRLQVKRASADELGTQQMSFDPAVEPYGHVADAMNLTKLALDLRKQAALVREVEHAHALCNVDRLPPQPVIAAIEAQLDKMAACAADGYSHPMKRRKKGETTHPSGQDKAAAERDMPGFTEQDRSAKAKEVYKSLKEEHPGYSAGKKARIAEAAADESSKGKGDQPGGIDYSEKKATVLVNSCARCGRDHEVDFLPFQKAAGDWTYWGTCPETREPILMNIEGDQAQAPVDNSPLGIFFRG